MSQLVHNNIHSCQKQIIVFLLLLDKNTVFHEYKGLNVKTLGIYALRWNKLFPVSVKWLNIGVASPLQIPAAFLQVSGKIYKKIPD